MKELTSYSEKGHRHNIDDVSIQFLKGLSGLKFIKQNKGLLYLNSYLRIYYSLRVIVEAVIVY